MVEEEEVDHAAEREGDLLELVAASLWERRGESYRATEYMRASARERELKRFCSEFEGAQPASARARPSSSPSKSRLISRSFPL